MMSGLGLGVGCWLFNWKFPDSSSRLRLTWPPLTTFDCDKSFCNDSAADFLAIFRRSLKKVKEAAMVQSRRTKKTMTTVTPTSTADFDATTLKTSTSHPFKWTPAGRSASRSWPLWPRGLWSSSFKVKFAMQPRNPEEQNNKKIVKKWTL